MLLVSEDGEIRAANSRACDLFGFDDLVSRSVDDLLPPGVADAHRTHRAGFMTDPQPRVMGGGRRLLARRHDGSEFPIDVSLGLTDAVDERLVSVAIRDVTERQAAHARGAVFEFVVAATREAIFAADTGGLITSWNEAAHRLTGVPAVEALGTPLPSQLRLRDPGLSQQLLDRALAGEIIDGLRAVVVGHGTSTPTSLSVAPMADPTGRLIGASGMARDISEEVETQEVLAEVQSRMIQTQRLARIGLWAWDPDTDEVQWSEQLYELAGVSPNDFEGDLSSHLSIVGSDHRPKVEAAMRDAASVGARFEVEYELVRPDGERRWIHQTGDPVRRPDRRVTELRGICQDLTDRHRAVESLREADRLKDEFLGTVSHELRTPLTSIIGFGDILRNNVDDELRNYAEIILRNGHEMHDMVERILDFSRVRSGRLVLAPERRRVEELVDDAWPLVVSLLAEHRVDRAFDDDAIAIVDGAAFSRIFVNLVDNAAKFSPPGSTIRVSARCAGARCRMEISDEGPGIPADEIETVFERFHQVPSTMVPQKRGAGIGLSIVRSYTELLGGRVWAESDGRGTTMVVEFPA